MASDPAYIFLPGDREREVPVRGVTPGTILTPEELRGKFHLVSDVHFRIFDLENEQDLRVYETLMSACASFPFAKVIRRVTDPAHPWKVGIEWYERFAQPRQTGVFVSSKSFLE